MRRRARTINKRTYPRCPVGGMAAKSERHSFSGHKRERVEEAKEEAKRRVKQLVVGSIFLLFLSSLHLLLLSFF